LIVRTPSFRIVFEMALEEAVAKQQGTIKNIQGTFRCVQGTIKYIPIRTLRWKSERGSPLWRVHHFGRKQTLCADGIY
jgi:hypothetical protein